MALKRKLQDENIILELILDSNAHISDDDIPFPQSDSDSEEDNGTDTGCIAWTNTTQS
jgi:hypothetical protein